MHILLVRVEMNINHESSRKLPRENLISRPGIR